MSNETIDTILESLEEKIDEETKNLAEMKKSAQKMVDRLKKEKDYNEKILDIFKKYQPIDSEIVKLNVGGTLFSTLKSTLTKKIKNPKTCEFYKDSIFEELLSGDLESKYDENKAIFIDRNPQYFGLVLDYLRMANTEEEFKLPAAINKNELKKEAKFYQLNGLLDKIDSV